MKLSVVILNYNVRYFLELCLESVVRAINSIDAEVIVVDNNSNDDSCAMVKSLFPKVILIENQNNDGFSKGNNIGVKIAKGEYVCILNPDTIVPEDCFSTLLQFADEQKELGLVGCQLIDGRGDFLPESKRNIPFPSIALKKLFGFDSDYYAKHLKPNEVGKVDVLVGAFMVLRRAVYNKVGGFDEDYFMYGEDIDLSYKVFKAGYKNYYFGKAKVVHFKGESTLKDLKYAKRFYGAMQIFYKKHFKRNILFDILVSVGTQLALRVRHVSKTELPRYKRVIVYSRSQDLDLKSIYGNNIIYTSQLSPLADSDTLIVYDVNSLNIKAIISHMKKNSINSNVYYRFLSKTSTFILGSDSATDRGEIKML
ncbi:glycosyltransferase family 2 protein [Winogradskyella sp. DF17]|uniref:Glycosyltransferase family 2 protein n=1 Tax=Winogradskyella pelagia TaxID=2819984 RepID=A0ABS3T2U3_9FLAO|nr:glycosyltransferase family 2 protein [Winogradskyella sp. DF17]MBO3116764.1 glycosyltransferase family 2 protein [Winogradskyella sp. DF17]